MTVPAACVLALAVGGLGALAAFDAAWHLAGSGAAPNANEDIALLAWIVGWCLLAWAAVALAAWLVAGIRDALAHRRASLVNVSVFVLCIAVMWFAAAIAPLWGAGAGAAA